MIHCLIPPHKLSVRKKEQQQKKKPTEIYEEKAYSISLIERQ